MRGHSRLRQLRFRRHFHRRLDLAGEPAQPGSRQGTSHQGFRSWPHGACRQEARLSMSAAKKCRARVGLGIRRDDHEAHSFRDVGEGGKRLGRPARAQEDKRGFFSNQASETMFPARLIRVKLAMGVSPSLANPPSSRIFSRLDSAIASCARAAKNKGKGGPQPGAMVVKHGIPFWRFHEDGRFERSRNRCQRAMVRARN